ncbi:IclR family transcriptional regulator [Georgenia yuyongxinii]|uniref:IclR family transcriptional regulator n=1 Tax=Georgenia yuyongxinii TaxID=2589797 RepID=A0A5B8CCC6_9MICO|nr:IclR family transcriptional regulator [Georgenia yuyongxinii]QDC25786.1 IclR family transcriptional regulator [Georgenia yuyongxinii]
MARLTPAVLRTLDILELFLEDGDAVLTAPQVVRRTGLPRTTVHELLATLVSRDYLQKDDAGAYRLGVRLLQLGNAYSARFDMLQAANDVAREVSNASGETVSVALLEGAEVFYLAKVEARELVPMASRIGQRLPASSTSLGKAMLAYVPVETVRALYPDPEHLPVLTERSIRTLPALEEELAAVRARGVAFEREESGRDICCAAAPVHDMTGQVVAAISTSVPMARWDSRPVEYWVDLVRQGAAQLSDQLGYQAPLERRARVAG